MDGAVGAAPARTLVFYDGVCGLCNRFVRFLLHRDRRMRLRFAPLQGEAARQELLPRGYDPADLDTVFAIAGWRTADPRVLSRSRAVLYATAELGGAWRLFSAAGRLVPPVIADVVYDLVARRRYRVFGRFDSCPLPRPEWRDRFLD